jgi:pimeloyl-ACP methyl ester carboxylesterase
VTTESIVLHNGPLSFSGLSEGEGPLVLLLHGFPDTPTTFAKQLYALADAGYRAVAMTMRGYEPSSQPEDGDYHAIRMAEDVVAWLNELGAARAHLVGHDWGSNIAHAAAALAPDRFASLTAIAVPHPLRFGEVYAASPEQQARSAYILDFLQPNFEEAISANDFAYLANLWRTWSPGWDSSTLFTEMKRHFSERGVARAALEYYQQGFDTTSPAALATAALFAMPIKIPTLGLCGAGDGCIGPDIFEAAMRSGDYPAGLRYVCIANAGHFVHTEAPERVNALLLEWFAANPA